MFFIYGFTSFFTCSAFEIYQSDIDAGLIITESGNWLLAESVNVHESPGIIIQAEDVVLDLQGNTIQASEDVENGILITAHNCSIKNGSLIGFSASAISLDTVSGVDLLQLFIIQNQSGVDIVNSSNVQLVQVHFDLVATHAVSIISSDYIRVGGCIIKNVGIAGIIIQDQSFGIALESVRVFNSDNVGLMINADDVQVTRASVELCKGDGIVINGKNIFCDSVVSQNNSGSGFVVNNSDITLRSCIASCNGIDGVTIGQDVDDLKIVCGIYSLNQMIGINNKGNTTNQVLSAHVYQNKKRDFNRMVHKTV